MAWLMMAWALSAGVRGGSADLAGCPETLDDLLDFLELDSFFFFCLL